MPANDQRSLVIPGLFAQGFMEPLVCVFHECVSATSADLLAASMTANRLFLRAEVESESLIVLQSTSVKIF